MYESLSPMWENIFITVGFIMTIVFYLMLIYVIGQVPNIIFDKKMSERQWVRGEIKSVVEDYIMDHEQEKHRED